MNGNSYWMSFRGKNHYFLVGIVRKNAWNFFKMILNEITQVLLVRQKKKKKTTLFYLLIFCEKE